MKVAVLSDTHAPRYWKACPPEVAGRLDGVDLILHAGDVCRAGVLEELAAFAPVRAVLGNNDTPDVAAWGAPETLELDLDGLAVAMVHDAGPAQGRTGRLRRRFPGAELVVFGHSHIPLDLSRRRRRGADLQPGVADRPAPPAAGHDGPAPGRGRAAAGGRDRPGHLDRGVSARERMSATPWPTLNARLPPMHRTLKGPPEPTTSRSPVLVPGAVSGRNDTGHRASSQSYVPSSTTGSNLAR